METEVKEALKAEMVKHNRGNTKTLKLFFAQDDEIKPLWEIDFPINQTMIQTYIPEKGKMTAYSLTRISDLCFWLSKISVSYWWQDFSPADGITTSARVNGLTYEDSPADIFTAYQILTLSDKWKEKRIADWLEIFDHMVKFIKYPPSDINGKMLPDFKKLMK